MTEVDISPARQLERVEPGGTLGLQRGAVAICIPLYGSHDFFVQSLQSALAHTPDDVVILVADDASPDPASERFLEELNTRGVLRHRVVYLRQPKNVGFVGNANTAFNILAPADVVILNSDVVVGPEWLERMQAAAYSDTNIATASALTNHGTILSVPNRNRPTTRLPDDMDAEAVARAVADRSPRLRPRLPTAVGHCVYFRRDALELVGGFDEAFSPGYGEEVDYSQRCLAKGLANVAADDVFVLHYGAGTFGGAGGLHRLEHEEVIRSRYPFYHRSVDHTQQQRTGPLPRTLAAAQVAVRPLSLTFDVRFLGPIVTGAHLQALELIHALWRRQEADLRVLAPPRLSEWARHMLESLDGVQLVEPADLKEGKKRFLRTDVVHRPSQVFSWPELGLIPRLGERVVITHLDLIYYRNPTYAQSFAEWHEYQRLTRLALALADCVVFMSEHAARDALAEDLVDERRVRVVPLGIDHELAAAATAKRPRRLPSVAESEFLLCIGTNFRHKNREFALRLLESLHQRHGWDGWLVFAGPHASGGTSAGDEAAFLSTRPAVAARAVDLRAVSEDEKLWLLQHAKGVVYPSTYEGFGLVPFEAAENGRPCFFAYHTSLRDVLPSSSATLVPWNADLSADAVMPSLRDAEVARALVDDVVEAGRKLTWARTAESMLDVYKNVVVSPSRDLARLADVRTPFSMRSLTRGRSPDNFDLEADRHRALYVLATNPVTREPFLRAAKGTYALGYFLRHGRRPPRL